MLASAGLVLIPGIGPLLAAGTAAATLSGAAAGGVGGGVAGGLVGALIGAGEDEDDGTETHARYRQTITGHGYVVTVTVPENATEETAEVLRDQGAQAVTVLSADY